VFWAWLADAMPSNKLNAPTFNAFSIPDGLLVFIYSISLWLLFYGCHCLSHQITNRLMAIENCVE
jgi:hypothetical protein